MAFFIIYLKYVIKIIRIYKALQYINVSYLFFCLYKNDKLYLQNYLLKSTSIIHIYLDNKN